MPPLLPSPAFNHPDNKPPLNLLSAVPSLADPDNAVVDGQRVPDTPNPRPSCYLISPTYVVESSISDAPDLIALSPTDYLGLLPECNSPPSYLENELDEEPTLPSYECVLGDYYIYGRVRVHNPSLTPSTALYDPLAGSDRIDQSLDTVPVSHEQRLRLLSYPQMLSVPATRNNDDSLSSAAPPPSKPPLQQDEFLSQLL